MKRPWCTLLLLAGLALAALPASAQTGQTGVIQGRVLTQAGAPVAGAAVRAAQPDGSYARSAVSGADGTFRISFLPPGRYGLVVRQVGMTEQTVPGLQVRAGEITTAEVRLSEGAVQLEGLVATAERPLIDVNTTATDTRLDADQIELLPAGRRATDFVNFVPGAREGQVWGGSTEQANAYQLDGVSVNQPGFGGDFLLPNVDWIQEISVRGLGAGAEYGNFQGGLVNIVTKSGTNTLSGAVRVNYESRDLNASNLNVRQAGEEVDGRMEVSADLGGPILRDRLWFYVAGSQLGRDLLVLDATRPETDGTRFLPLTEERTERKLLGKLTWQATERDIVNLGAGYDAVFTDRFGLNSFDTPETASKQESPAYFYNASWQRTWNADNLLEVKLTGYSGRDDRLPYNGDLPAVQRVRGNRETFQNAIYTREYTPRSLGLSANWDSYWRTGALSHRLKVGGDYTMGWWREQRIRNGGFTWRPFSRDPVDPADPGTWGLISSDWGGGINLDTRTVNAAAYVQDYIDVGPRLKVNPGVRLGVWQGYITPGFVTDGAARDEFKAVEDWGIDPRLGAVLDVTGDGTWVAKAHWGRFHQNIFALMYDRVEGGNVFQDVEYWDWIGDGDPDPTRVYTPAERAALFESAGGASVAQQVGPVVDWDQPYVDQWTVGVERALGGRWKAEVLYVNRRNRDLVGLVDRNLASNWTWVPGVSVIDYDSGDPILGTDLQPLVLPGVWLRNDDVIEAGGLPGMSDAELAALSYDPDYALTNVPGTRKFDQVQVSLTGELAAWSVRGSVAWTDLRGDVYTVTGYQASAGTGAGAFVNPNFGTNFFGELPDHSEWEAKVQASGELPWGLRAGVFATYFTGDPYTPVYEVDRNVHDLETADGALIPYDAVANADGDEIFLEPRGSRTLDDRMNLDLHLDRVFPFRRTRLVVGLDVFNVFNEDVVTDVRTLVNDQLDPNPAPDVATQYFGAPRFRVAPRTLRLTASVRI